MWSPECESRWAVGKVELGETLFSTEEIGVRVRDLAREISKDYQGQELILVGILKGAFVFLADLARCLTIPVR